MEDFEKNKRARIDIQPRFKIQYPMKNHSEGIYSKHICHEKSPIFLKKYQKVNI